MSLFQLNESENEAKVVICSDCNKILYTRKAAGYLINEMHGRHGMRRYSGKVPVRLYHCNYNPGFYHVTSKRFNPDDPILTNRMKDLENVV